MEEKMLPTVLIKRGALSDRAVAELRKAGYCVVQAADPSAVKQLYPENFTSASNAAKIAAFEYAVSDSSPHCTDKNDLRRSYIHYLKQAKVF